VRHSTSQVPPVQVICPWQVLFAVQPIAHFVLLQLTGWAHAPPFGPQVIWHSSEAVHVTPPSSPAQELSSTQRTSQVFPLHLTEGQDRSPSHAIEQRPASQVIADSQESFLTQETVHSEPLHAMGPVHDGSPSQTIAQALAREQSTNEGQEPLPLHSTSQGTPAGHTTPSAQEPPPVHVKRQWPASSQAPASGQTSWQSTGSASSPPSPGRSGASGAKVSGSDASGTPASGGALSPSSPTRPSPQASEVAANTAQSAAKREARRAERRRTVPSLARKGRRLEAFRAPHGTNQRITGPLPEVPPHAQSPYSMVSSWQLS
jgi:hypothetical protein